VRAGPGHHDDGLGLVAVDQGGGNSGVAGIGDLDVDGAGAAGRFGEHGLGAGHGDHPGAGLRQGGGDPLAQAAAGTDDDRGLVGQVGHGHCALINSST
jgi:hypothetical protein